MKGGRRTWWLSLLGLIVLASSCLDFDAVEPYGLRAFIELDSSSVSRCVVVRATGVDGGSSQTAPVAVSPGQTLSVPIYKERLSSQVMLQAQGFSALGCAGPADEFSPVLAASFIRGAVPTYSLTLHGEGTCDDGADGDGDGLVDCADPVCATFSGCADGGTVTAFPYPPSNFSPAAFPTPDAGLVISCDAGYDTGSRSGWLCGAPLPASYVIDRGAAGPLVLVAVNSLSITSAGYWRITGPYPLILAVYGNASIDGPLFGGAVGVEDGPGASRPGCPGRGGQAQDGGNGGGGGGGAGYGGAGAPGSQGGGTPAGGGDAGGSFGTPLLVPLLAGCRGGSGGLQTSNAVPVLEGGGGGGAIQLSAAGTVQVGSVIGVPGGGGRGGSVISNNGGGGGGSGGAILLEGAQLIFTPTARVTANGGAGAEGGDSTTSASGADGRTDGSLPARGGSSVTFIPGGDGGAGSVNPTSGTITTGSNFGGGGGGGGVGRIRLNTAAGCTFQGPPGLVLSPPATSNRAGDAGCP